MSVYLEDHPPARRQYYTQRKATVSGAIVVHTAENNTDTYLPDGGAEAVAGFISRRGEAGSYHSLVDSDSIVNVGRYEWQMFGEGTGGNRWALHLSFACKASQWNSSALASWVRPAIEKGATEAISMAAWVKSTTGIIVPAVRISEAEYRAGKPGFIGHGDIDPGRRSDPGDGFPWSVFLAMVSEGIAGRPVGTAPAHPAPPTSILQQSLTFAQAMEEVEALYELHRAARNLSADDYRTWAADVHHKMYVEGVDIRPTLAFINWALSNEPNQ